jgi:hypothetical protein
MNRTVSFPPQGCFGKDASATLFSNRKRLSARASRPRPGVAACPTPPCCQEKIIGLFWTVVKKNFSFCVWREFVDVPCDCPEGAGGEPIARCNRRLYACAQLRMCADFGDAISKAALIGREHSLRTFFPIFCTNFRLV